MEYFEKLMGVSGDDAVSLAVVFERQKRFVEGGLGIEDAGWQYLKNYVIGRKTNVWAFGRTLT